MADRRRAPFRTLGMRMQDFGRNLMRHYVPPESAPLKRNIVPPPAWQSDSQTPLIWNEPSGIPAPLQDQFVPDVEPEMPPVESLPFEPPAPPRPTAPRPPAPAQPASVQRKPAKDEEKIDPRLLAILAAHKEHDDYAAQVREERKAAVAAAEIQRKADESQPDATLTRRRSRTSFDYVETRTLQPQEGEPGYVPPPKNLPPADVIQPTRSPDEPDDDDTEASSPAAIFASEPEVQQPDLTVPDDTPPAPDSMSTTLPLVQRTTDPERPLQTPVSEDQPTSFLSSPAETPVPPAPQPTSSATEAESQPSSQPTVQRSPEPRPSVQPQPSQPPTRTQAERPNTPARRETPPAAPTIQRQIESPATAVPPTVEPEAASTTAASSFTPQSLNEPGAPESRPSTRPPVQRQIESPAIAAPPDAAPSFTPQPFDESSAPESRPSAQPSVQRQIESATPESGSLAQPPAANPDFSAPVLPTAIETPSAPIAQSSPTFSEADETASRQAASSASADNPQPSVPSVSPINRSPVERPVVQRQTAESTLSDLITPDAQNAAPDQPVMPISSVGEPVASIQRQIETEPEPSATTVEPPARPARPTPAVEPPTAPERPRVQRTAEVPAPEPTAPQNPMTNIQPDFAPGVESTDQPAVPPQPPAAPERPVVQRAIEPPQPLQPISRAGNAAETEAFSRTDSQPQNEVLSTPSQADQPPAVQRRIESSARRPVEPAAPTEIEPTPEAPALPIVPDAAAPSITSSEVPAIQRAIEPPAIPASEAMTSKISAPASDSTPSQPIQRAVAQSDEAVNFPPVVTPIEPDASPAVTAQPFVSSAESHPTALAHEPVSESVDTAPSLPFEPRETAAPEPTSANPAAPSVASRPTTQPAAPLTEIARKPISDSVDTTPAVSAELSRPAWPVEAPSTTSDQPMASPVESRPVELHVARPAEIARKSVSDSANTLLPDVSAEPPPVGSRPVEIARKPTANQPLPDLSAEHLPFDAPEPPLAPSVESRPTEIARKPAAPSEPAAVRADEDVSSAEQPIDVFQALVASGMIPPPAAAQPLARIDRKTAPPEAEPLPYEDMPAPEQPIDVFQAMVASGMIPPPGGQRPPQIARKPEPSQPRSISAQSAPDRLPVQYAAPTNHVMRAETDEEEPERPESSESSGKKSGNTDIEKLAQDVYSALRNRLRVEKERRGRG